MTPVQSCSNNQREQDEKAAHALLSSHLSTPEPFITSPTEALTRKSSTDLAPSKPQSLRRLTATHPPPVLQSQFSIGNDTEKKLGIAEKDRDTDLHRAAKLIDLVGLKDKIQGEEMQNLIETRRLVDNLEQQSEMWSADSRAADLEATDFQARMEKRRQISLKRAKEGRTKREERLNHEK